MTLSIDKATWKRVSLGDVAAASKEKVDPSASVVNRYVAGEHMDSDDLKIHRWGNTSDVDLGPAFHRRFRPGQVLYGSRRAYLRKVVVADFDGVCANTTYVLESKDEHALLQEFLPFVVSSEPFHAFAIRESKGSVNPYVNWSDLERFEFDLPPLDVQKRIADLLWAIEQDRRASADVLGAADEARASLRNELFEALSAPTEPFQTICSIPSQNGVTLKKSERAGQTPMVNMGEMFRGEVISTSTEYERVTTPETNFLLSEGDLLFARRSIVFEGAGACCLVPELTEPFTFESSVIRARALPHFDPRYLLHFFRSDRGRSTMAQIVRRGPVSGISGSDLRKLEIPVIPRDLQSDIVRQIESLDPVRPVVNSRSQRAVDLASAILSDTFGGS